MAAPAKQLSDANPGGTGLGQSVTDLIGFYGVTAVAQQTTADQAAVSTTAPVSATANVFGFQTSAQIIALINCVNAIRFALVQNGLIKGS